MPTPINQLPAGCKPGRGFSGVQTTWGARNAAFCAARKAARKGDIEDMEAKMRLMEKVQAISEREREAIMICTPARAHPAPRQR